MIHIGTSGWSYPSWRGRFYPRELRSAGYCYTFEFRDPSWYDDRIFALLAERLVGWASQGREVWCYFDNDTDGHAPNDAARLKVLLTLGGAGAWRTPPRR